MLLPRLDNEPPMVAGYGRSSGLQDLVDAAAHAQAADASLDAFALAPSTATRRLGTDAASRRVAERRRRSHELRSSRM